MMRTRATLAEKGAKPVAITNLGEAQTLGSGGIGATKEVRLDVVEISRCD